MLKSIEILVSAMNIKNKNEFENFIDNTNCNNVKISVINQITKDNVDLINIKKERSIYSYKEIGASRSRNRALENATGDICLFADDDVKYVDGYKDIITAGYKKFPKADIIVFNIESKNANRKIKKIRTGKMNRLNIMKVRTSQISFKRAAIDNQNIKFDENFGPGAIYNNGEETIFLSDCIKKGLKVYSYNYKIANVENKESTWFNGFSEKYFFNRGAVFGRLYPKFKYLMILQFVIRKYNMYRNDCSAYTAFKNMVAGVKSLASEHK